MYKSKTHRWASLGFLGLCAALGLAAGAHANENCPRLQATGNPEYPPFLWRDPEDESKLIGANADLMQLLSKELGLPIEVRYGGSWARVQEDAKLGRIDLIAGAFFTLPRLDYMDYMHPAFKETRTVIWTRADANLKYRKWSDLVGLQGVTVINNSFGEEFDRYAKESLKIATVPSLELALKMLEKSRSNYLIYEEDPGQAFVAKMNIGGLRTITPPITNENLYLTISHKSPCNTGEMRGRLAKAMYKFAKQNVMAKLIETNIQLWRKQTK